MFLTGRADQLYIGIDTSCYTTSIACIQGESIVLDERAVLSVPLGTRGLRQSDALFQHNRNLPLLLERAFESLDAERIAGVGVSAKPTAQQDSYMPVFLAGVLAARALAYGRSVPCELLTHQLGHVRAALHGNEMLLGQPRFLALHLSGGTTDVLSVSTADQIVDAVDPLGGSTDLHAGQFVDRIGVRLGLPFPCGRALEALARTASVKELRFPSAVKGLRCSLSGAESQAQRALDAGEPGAEVAYGVYDCLARTVAKLIRNASETSNHSAVLLSGGVASSLLLRELLTKRLQGGPGLYFGEPALSSDNAVGVAFAAREALCSRN